MKLLYTANSPYSRITRVCALEHAIDLELELVGVRGFADVILEYNPSGKVPSLKLDDGSVLSESRLICEHFDWMTDSRFTAAVTESGRRCLEGFASGFLDGIAVWVREVRRPRSEQSPQTLQLEDTRARRCLAYFERNWDTGSTRLNYASVALASAIELLDTRLQSDWHASHPNLSRWFDNISKTPSLRATAPLRG